MLQYILVIFICYGSKYLNVIRKYKCIGFIKHDYLSRNLKFVLNVSNASHSLLQQTEVIDVSHDQCYVTQAGVGLVGAPGQRLDNRRRRQEHRGGPHQESAESKRLQNLDV